MNWTVVLTVGPILFAGPPIVAVILCERHANSTAQTIRKQQAQPTPRQVRAVRPKAKELIEQ